MNRIRDFSGVFVLVAATLRVTGVLLGRVPGGQRPLPLPLLLNVGAGGVVAGPVALALPFAAPLPAPLPRFGGLFGVVVAVALVAGGEVVEDLLVVDATQRDALDFHVW